MHIKSIIVGLLSAVALTASAQSDVLSVEYTDRQPDATLGGKAAVVFRAASDDYVITSTIHEECQTPPQRVGNGYEYRMLIDLQGRKRESRVFIVKKSGTPYEGKSPQKQVLADNVSTYVKSEIKTKIGGNDQVSRNTFIEEKGNQPKLACIEVLVPQELEMTVNVSKSLNATVTESTSAGNKVHKIVFDTHRFDELKALADSQEEKMNALKSQLEETTGDAEQERLAKQQEELEPVLASTRADYENASIITISGKDINTLTIDADKIRSLTPKDKLIYGVVIVEKEVMKEYSYEELLAQARERYKGYPQHTDFNYYDGAMTAYKTVMAHKDCPDAMRPTLNAEYDSIISMRRLVGFYERFVADAGKAEKNSEKEYKNLAAALRAVNRLLKYHPELVPFTTIRQGLRDKVHAHPMGQRTVQRQVVSGRISYADASMAEPFKSLGIYASAAEKVDYKRSQKIGGVNDDGTYRVVIPDHTLYIFVSGERKAHYIGNGTQQLDIVIE